MQRPQELSILQQTKPQKLERAHQVLKQTFGFDSFRPPQAEIIVNVLGAENTLAIMPTGGGKSLCYQIPAMLFDGLSIVISPLISLMQDQVRQLDELNVPACFLNSTLSADEYKTNLDQIKNGEIKMLFLAPETALQTPILNLLQAMNVSCLAIDEAHCISEWGHEFRPEYRQLHLLLERLEDVICLALTATATPRVRQDIKRQLNIENDCEFISSFDRPNLYIEVSEKDSPYRQTKAFIDKYQGQSGIIYCQSRASVNELTDKLQSDGYSALAYHGGMNAVQRSQSQDQFVRDDVDIMVATIAFGMGINKPDVRYVLHYDLPKNIESYYQQIGRAGRDGADADCLLLFAYGDIGKHRYFIDQMQNEQEQRLASMHLNQMLALAETEDCRRIGLLQYFGEQNIEQSCKKCDNCLNENKQQYDLSLAAQKFLSCVYRTGQIFGAGHVIDVLRGSSAEKVLQNQHNLLSTYGIGKEYTKKQWMALSRQLLQKGILKQDDKFGGLKFTPNTQAILKGQQAFMGRLQKAKAETAVTAKTATITSGNQGLVQILKEQRKRLADKANVPPYAVFSDRSLQEMAYYLPHSEQSFLKIHGVGQSKAEKYADIFLPIIAKYCQEQDLEERENAQTASLSKTKTENKLDLGDKTLNIVQALEKGESIATLANKHKVKVKTIYAHLYKYVQLGKQFSSAEPILQELGMADSELTTGLSVFNNLGFERLKPVYDELNESVSYEQLHLLRVYFLHLENTENK